jgi:xanthine dehydrogenase molybdenum-binding subunit
VTASVIGTRPLRHDGIDKVTGRALYGADVRMPRLLHGHVVRSPHAHARILSIDATRALALPGVKAVISAADFPEDVQPVAGAGVEPLAYLRDNILASHKALYKGHAVAAIAATSPHIAAQAAELVEVRYEVLPTVLTGLEAMRSGAPRLHDDLRTKEPGEPVGALSNVAKHVHHAWGDVDAGFAEAAVVVERSFDTATVHQGYIEPHNATAVWNHDDRILIWCSTQGAFGVRDVTARVLDVPISRVTVYPMEIGGGFGGKLRVYLEPVAALLSRKAGCPVKIVMSRADVFEGTGPAPASHVDLKIGARDDGRITAAQASLIYEAGAFPGAMVGLGALCVFAAYDIPNIAIEGFDVVVNKPSTAAYRAPGAPNAAFATETVLDEIAERLALDPIELRLLNIAREGTRRADGVPHGRIGGVEVLEAMRRHLHYRTPLGRPYRGRGIALGYWINEGHPSCCSITPNADGTATLLEGSVDIGGTRTSIAMQAA